jgi:hypothetical protein
MATVETGWYRCEGGTVVQMDHPLPEGIAQRVSKGEIIRVKDETGDPWVEPQAEATGELTPAEALLLLERASCRIADLVGEKYELQQQVAVLESQVATLKACNDDGNQVLADLRARVAELETSPATTEVAVEAVEAEPVKPPRKSKTGG